MNVGEFLTLWTARLAMALYVAALVSLQFGRERSTPLVVARWIWTGGLLVFLLHLICAFEFYHGWSHAEAYAFTARQTSEAVLAGTGAAACMRTMRSRSCGSPMLRGGGAHRQAIAGGRE
ncbi:MAG: hypothetical protein WD176_06210 [Pirellulales bacterium]